MTAAARHRTLARPGYLLLTLTAGEGRCRAPAHLDVLVGAARPATALTGGRVDRVLGGAGAFRTASVFPARRNLTRVGARGDGYDELEERCGLSRTYRVQVADPARTAAVVQRLRELPTVESAALEQLVRTDSVDLAPHPDLDTPHPDALAPYRMVHSPAALALEPGDERVTLAVVDTGVALGHPEFQRKLLSGYDVVELGLGALTGDTMLIGDSHGRDFSPADDVGHGSHVAGIASAQGWRIPPGVGGRSLLLPIRVLAGARIAGSPAVTGVGAVGDIDAGLKVAIDLGAQVINMSFGTPAGVLDPDAPPPHREAVAYARSTGCVLIAAAGNAGTDEPFYPAALPGVIAVGSVGPGLTRSPFSSYGDHLALAAPGEHIVGVGRRGYDDNSGTSFAAPFVSGAAALLLAHARRRARRLTPDEVAGLLRASAQPTDAPAPEVGAGVLDITAALTALDRLLTTTPPSASSPEGGSHG